MPAAAVIPAPIAYIKVVAVKKLVVEFLVGFLCMFFMRAILFKMYHLPYCGLLHYIMVHSIV